MSYLAKITKRLALAGRTLLVTAIVAGCTPTDAVTSSDDTVADVVMASDSVVASAGSQLRLAAELRDNQGRLVWATPLTWTTSDPQIATVDATGLVTLTNTGLVEIWATFGRHRGRTRVYSTVAKVVLTPSSLALSVGSAATLSAQTLSATGAVLGGGVVRWSSTGPSVASVDASGRVVAIGSGSAMVIAASDAAADTSTLTVTALPGTVSDLVVASIGDTVATLRFTEVSDGNGGAASYEVRSAPSSISWSTASAVARGTCAAPVAGSSVGSVRSCTVAGLQPGTAYEFQLAAFRGTLGTTVYGTPSNIARSTTGAVAVASVTVNPASASAFTGATSAFAATLRDAGGSVISGRTVTWSSTNAAVATVNASGVATALVAGTTTIRATSGGVTGSASLTVSLPVLQSLQLAPGSISLAAGATQQFGVSGLLSNGASTVPSVTYSATGGTISASGLYTAGSTAGTFRVIATQQGGTKADTSAVTVTVVAPTLQAVLLTPASVSLNSGATQQYAVAGQWSNGAMTAPSVTYSATGGTINAAGLYTAGSTAGTFRVIATQQGGTLADTSAVTITVPAPTLTAVILTPASVSLLAGATQQFGVSGQWSNGATTAPAVTYSATGGTINTAGLYTAGSTAGTFRVIATQQGGTKADTSAVTVTVPAPTLTAVILTPASVSLNSGATQQFSVSGQWSNGATTAPAVTYTATGGTVTSGGLYTAGTTGGTYRVIAKQSGGTLADTAVVTIAAPVLQAVVLTPGTATVYSGATQQYTVSALWSNGGTTAPPVTYSATGGTITAGGLYVAGATLGTFRVIAVQQGGVLADTSVVTVASAPTSAANPHEPAGMTTAFNEAWNTTPNGRSGTNWITDGPGGNFSIVSDPTAPKSSGNVLQVSYPAGFGAGYSPAQAYYGYDGGLPTNTGTLYVRVWVKVSSNWTDNGNSGTKFFFPRPYAGEGGGASVQTNHLFRLTDHGQVDFGFITQLNGSEGEYHTGANLAKGMWHDMEFLLTLGSSGSANDGTVKVWANGNLILNATGIKMLANGMSIGRGWQYLFLDPTYGGGTNAPPANLNFQIDHWYASVK